MRDIKTLLYIVIDSLSAGHKDGWHNTGICGEADDLYKSGVISDRERIFLVNYVNANKPKDIGDRDMWWWDWMFRSPEMRYRRIEFLTLLLNKLNNK